MLIYGSGEMSPFGPVQYKSARSRSRKTTRKKTSKGVGRPRRRRVGGSLKKKKRKSTKKKVKKRRRRRAVGGKRKRKLNAKNVKFLRRLGLRVREP